MRLIWFNSNVNPNFFDAILRSGFIISQQPIVSALQQLCFPLSAVSASFVGRMPLPSGLTNRLGSIQSRLVKASLLWQ